MRRRFGLAAASALFTIAGASAADAQEAPGIDALAEVDDDDFDRDLDDWTLRGRIGAGAEFGPAFYGARATEVTPQPVLDVTFGRFFLDTEQGLGVVILNGAAGDVEVQAGAAIGVGFDGDRDDADDPGLRGIGDIDLPIEAKAFVEVELGPVEFGATVGHDIGSGHEATFVDVEIGVGGRLSERIAIGAEIGARWGSAKYVRSYFGVDPMQSAASGLPPFRPSSGFTHVEAELAVEYSFSRRWSLGLSGGVGRLLDDARRSPISRRDTYGEVGAALIFRFR